MATVKKDRVRQQTDIAAEFHAALSIAEPMTVLQLMAATGRLSAGGPQYTAIMASMVKSGQATLEVIPTAGRPRKAYRKVRMQFYNTLEDKRMTYKQWHELPMAVKQQALDRYEGQQEWLNNSDWLYPTSTVRGKGLRLGKADRILGISIEEAEERREAWRRRKAAEFMPQ
jgi:hypothetical protein